MGVVLLALGLAAGSTVVFTQSVTFEVASIKSSHAADDVFDMRTVGDTYTATNVSGRTLINQAYSGMFFDSEILGAPNWLRDERFSIVARMPAPNMSAAPMLRNMLVERFKLRTHEDTRELPAYRLVVARGDGRLGPQLTASTRDCAAALAGNGPRCGFSYRPGLSLGQGRRCRC